MAKKGDTFVSQRQRYWMQILQEASLLSRLGGSSRRLGLFDAGVYTFLFSGWNAEEGINAIPRRSERCVQNSLYARFLLFNRMNISGTSTASFDARFSGTHRSGSTAFLLAFLRCKTEEEACFDFEFHFLQSRTSLIQARIDFKFHLLKSRSL